MFGNPVTLLTPGDQILFQTPALRAKFGDRLTVTRVSGRWFWCGEQGQWGFTLQSLNEYVARGEAALICIPNLSPISRQQEEA